jgi:hypothetical protein
MLNARLFGILAFTIFVVTILGKLRVLPHGNLYFMLGTFRHHRHIGFGPLVWQSVVCLVCAIFALAYWGIARLKQRTLNSTTGLVGFLLIAFGSVVWLISGFLMTGVSLRGKQLTILLFAAMACFMWGMVVCTANVVWGTLRR